MAALSCSRRTLISSVSDDAQADASAACLASCNGGACSACDEAVWPLPSSFVQSWPMQLEVRDGWVAFSSARSEGIWRINYCVAPIAPSKFATIGNRWQLLERGDVAVLEQSRRRVLIWPSMGEVRTVASGCDESTSRFWMTRGNGLVTARVNSDNATWTIGQGGCGQPFVPLAKFADSSVVFDGDSLVFANGTDLVRMSQSSGHWALSVVLAGGAGSSTPARHAVGYVGGRVYAASTKVPVEKRGMGEGIFTVSAVHEVATKSGAPWTETPWCMAANSHGLVACHKGRVEYFDASTGAIVDIGVAGEVVYEVDGWLDRAPVVAIADDGTLAWASWPDRRLHIRHAPCR